MNGFVVSGLLMLCGVVLLSPMMIMAQSMGPHEISPIASAANESKCLLLSMRNGQKITLRGRVRSTAHDMAFDVAGCDQTVLLTYAGDRDNDVSATELRKDKELIRFQKYTSEVYKSTGKIQEHWKEHLRGMPKIRGCASRPDRQVGSCHYARRSDEGLGRISARSVGQSDGDVRLGTSPPVRSLPSCYRVCVSGKGAKATSTLSGTDACGKLSPNDQAARSDKNGHIERTGVSGNFA
jgi:hypothetical protein